MFYTSDQGCREISAQVLTEFYGKGSWSKEGKCCYSAMDSSLYPSLDEERLAYMIDIGLLIIIKEAMISMDSKSECRRQEEAVQKQLEILEKGISA